MCWRDHFFLIFAIWIAALSPAWAQQKTFIGEGSDTMMGIGGRYIGLAGSGAAVSNDIYALYFNPAGLAHIETAEISIAQQVNSELLRINFAGAAVAVPVFDRFGISTVVAAGYIPRLHMYADGAFAANDLESVFLRYALPGITGNFDGIISSKTKDYRVALAFAGEDSELWALGVSVGKVDCATFFCGVTAEGADGYKVISTGATAYTLNLGARYKVADNLTFGVSVKDVNTTLDVDVQITDTNGTRDLTFKTSFPTDVTVGVLWNYNDSLDLTADYQTMFGKYGNYDIDVRILRLGAEKRFGHIATRAGLVVPINISSSRLPEIVLPFPVAPTLGVGWNGDRLNVDMALYGHPIMSYSQNRIYLASDLSVSYKF